VEHRVDFIGPIPWNTFVGEASKRNNDVGIIVDEVAIKVGKAKERLNLLDILGSRPFEDGINLGLRHRNAGRRDNEAEEFCRLDGKFAFFRLHI